MSHIRRYLEMCLHIDLLKTEIRILRRQRKEVEREIRRHERSGPTPYRSPRFHDHKIDIKYSSRPNLDHYWSHIDEIKDIIAEKEKVLKALEYQKKKIDQLISAMDSTKNKVAVLRELQGKSLAEIADEIGYSESWVRKLSAEISREILNQD